MTTLHIFNPSTEIALARNTPSFTPAKQIVEFEKHLCLLPALYAKHGSSILLTHALKQEQASSLPYYSIAGERGMQLLTIEGLRRWTGSIAPWGWNKALLHTLNRAECTKDLPGEHAVEMVRNLAHRRTTIRVWQQLLHYADSERMLTSCSSLWRSMMPRCFSTVAEAMQFIDTQEKQTVLKSPWSSSGRGVFFTSAAEAEQIHRRVTDTIRAYGSVLIEPLWNRARDFASEWVYTDGAVKFLGFSLFTTDDAGRYAGNLVAPQDCLRSEIGRYVPADLTDAAISALAAVLPSVLAPLANSDGRVFHFGIDMLADTEGRLNPCVEINLRQTMGHVALRLHELTDAEFLFIPGKELPVPLKFTTFAK